MFLPRCKTLTFAKSHLVSFYPTFQPVQVSLNGSTSFWHVILVCPHLSYAGGPRSECNTVRSYENRIGRENHLLRPAGLASSDVAQDVVGLLDCKYTVSAHVGLLITPWSFSSGLTAIHSQFSLYLSLGLPSLLLYSFL